MKTMIQSMAVALLVLLAIGTYFSSDPVAQAPAGGRVALVGARLIDGTGSPAVENATILVANGRVEAVGSSSSIRVPEGTTRVDAAGKTVIPGLITAHAHMGSGDPSLSVADQVRQQLQLYAQYGVTSVVTLGDDGKESVRLRDENAKLPLDRARIFPAGEPLVPTTVEEARRLVNERADGRVSILKARMNGTPQDMTPPVYTALIDEVHKRGLKVAVHLFYLHEAKGLVGAGVDIVAHSVRDQDVDEALIAEMKKRNTALVPTLAREVSVIAYETTPDFFNDPFFLKGVTFTRGQLERLKNPAEQERYRQNPETARIKKALDQANRNLKRLSDAGVTIVMGTDTGAATGRFQGYFEHMELEMMVKAGLTPMQALTAATGTSARVLGFEGIGTIAPGKWADLIVLNGNPLTDIRNTRQIDSVWMAGQKLSATGTN